VAAAALAWLAVPGRALACNNDAECGPCNVCVGNICNAGPNVLCTKDVDCPPAQICMVDPDNACMNMCVPKDGCKSDADCFKCQLCIAGGCQGPDAIECTTDPQCKAGFFCKVDPNDECNNHCLQEGTCTVDSDCKQCQVCMGGACIGAGVQCTPDKPCPWPKKCKIDPQNTCNNICISDTACQTSEDCGPCQVCMDGACTEAGVVMCDENSDCMKGFVCKKDPVNPCDNQCVPYINCLDDEDCDQCEACMQGKCTATGPMECMSNLDCSGGEICQKSVDFCLNVCVSDTSCNTDADCGVCEACVGGACMGGLEIMCMEDKNCDPGMVCQIDPKDPCKNFCTIPLPDCTTDDDCGPCEACNNGACIASGVVACTEDAHCPEGWTCVLVEEDPCENMCEPPPPECISDADCGVCQACMDAECESIAEIKCTSDSDCDDGMACTNDPDDPCIVQCVSDEPGEDVGSPDVVSNPEPEEDVVTEDAAVPDEDIISEDVPGGDDTGAGKDEASKEDTGESPSDDVAEDGKTPGQDTAGEEDTGSGGGGGGGCTLAARGAASQLIAFAFMLLAILAGVRAHRKASAP